MALPVMLAATFYPLLVVTAGVKAATTQEVTLPPAAGNDSCVNLITGDFIILIRDIVKEKVLERLHNPYKLLPFEFLAAAESGELAYVLDILGWRPVLIFLDALPQPFHHQFIGYLIQHAVDQGMEVPLRR